MKFYIWYTQALGGVLGIASCIYSYLRGDIFTYSNISGNYDILGFGGVVASYLLYPLCFISFIFAIIIAIKEEIINRKIFNIQFIKYNSFFTFSTVIIGIIGCKLIFIIPSLFILCNYYIPFIFNNNKQVNLEMYNNNNCIENTNACKESNLNELKVLNTKKEIAIHLLHKDANINFINEITGLSLNELYRIKNEAKKIDEIDHKNKDTR